MSDSHTMPTSTFRVAEGRMAYTDVGNGPPIVFLHGNPTWAYMYRHLIDGLSDAYRCIAPDYLGFGRSEAPASFSYRPPHHAAHVEALLQHLDVRDATLVMHDWGGPIGLSYALRHPGRVRRLVLLNTWLWPHDGDAWIGTFSRVMGGPIGRFLIHRYNAFARWIIPLAMGKRSRLSAEAHDAYTRRRQSGVRRHASWVFPRALRTETPWLRAFWSDRHRLAPAEVLIAWGKRDLAFGSEGYLRRWMQLFPDATVHRFPSVGHYVAEEMGPTLTPYVRSFLDDSGPGETVQR